MEITLNNIQPSRKIDFSVFPVLNLIRINIKTEDAKWVDRFFPGVIEIEFTRIDDGAVSREYLPFAGFISPYSKELTFDINRFYKFQGSPETKASSGFSSQITLNNVVLKDNESIEIDIVTSEHIKKRVDDWKKRVDGLIDQIRDWQIKEIEIRPLRGSLMHEGLMKVFEIPVRQIQSVAVYKNNVLKIAIKPFGLWVIGANGRIDFLTSNGNYILIDESEEFAEPNWKILLRNTKKSDFTKEKFKELLEL